LQAADLRFIPPSDAPVSGLKYSAKSARSDQCKAVAANALGQVGAAVVPQSVDQHPVDDQPHRAAPIALRLELWPSRLEARHAVSDAGQPAFQPLHQSRMSCGHSGVGKQRQEPGNAGVKPLRFEYIAYGPEPTKMGPYRYQLRKLRSSLWRAGSGVLPLGYTRFALFVANRRSHCAEHRATPARSGARITISGRLIV
jgi:hypothetical protein